MYSQGNIELYQHKFLKESDIKSIKYSTPNAFNESTNKTASIFKNLDI